MSTDAKMVSFTADQASALASVSIAINVAYRLGKTAAEGAEALMDFMADAETDIDVFEWACSHLGVTLDREAGDGS